MIGTEGTEEESGARGIVGIGGGMGGMIVEEVRGIGTIEEGMIGTRIMSAAIASITAREIAIETTVSLLVRV
jgi:hypothetical protein